MWWFSRSKVRDLEPDTAAPRPEEEAASQPSAADPVLNVQRRPGNRAVHHLTGRALDPDTRGSMEATFRADLSEVRIHDDTSAARESEEVGAEAFTVGRDIYFGAGKYAADTPEGQRLLKHELTHTIQQQAGISQSPPDEALEREADAAASSNTVQVTGHTAPAHQRQKMPGAAESAPGLPFDSLTMEQPPPGASLSEAVAHFVARHMKQEQLPDFLQDTITQLAGLLFEKGMAAAFDALSKDTTIDEQYKDGIRTILKRLSKVR